MGCCFSKPKVTEPEKPKVTEPEKPEAPPQPQPPTKTPTQPPPPAQPEVTILPTPTTQPPVAESPLNRPPPGYPVETPLLTLEDCKSRFAKINNAGEADRLIDTIDQLLRSLLNKPTKGKSLEGSTSSQAYSDTLKDTTKSIWTSFLQSGSLFLEFVNKHVQQEKGDGGINRQVLAQILQEVGKVHWVVAGLSVVAFVLEQIGQISDNQSECIDLLKQMSKLAGHIKQLKSDMEEEEKILNEATVLIVEGSMMCASQLESGTLFRFLKASVDSRSFANLQSKINQVYQDLTLRMTIQIHHQQPVTFPSSKPNYPDYAVGIDGQKKKVMELLDIKARNKAPLAVVIYGFGGIGKTTLATAAIADLDLTDYNYSGVQIQEDHSRNDIKSIQQQILKDAFPAYTYGRNLTLRNSVEGRDHLTSAFQVEGNKPVFLFIDNALRAQDLQELFPKRLSGLPKQSRILITTRNLGEADMLTDAGLTRREHLVDTLPQEEARQILFGDFDPDNSKDRHKFGKALEICAGIPLVLEIVGARMRKQNYMVERCTQIIEALERGTVIKEENLSQRLVTFVYEKLEPSTQEAFLDICCFLANWNRRHVEYIVGAEEVTHLEEAALFKMSDKGNVIVHDIIRAKGRSMSESNRIMDLQSWLDVACDNQKLKQIKGVRLSREETESAFELDEKDIFSMKKSLRVLALGNKINVSLSGEKTPKFKELRFLRLAGEMSGLWPVNLEALERLAVFHGPVFKDGATVCKLPKRLRVLKATTQSQESVNSLESKPANVIQNSFLEVLDLKELKSLEKLPEWVHHLTSLKVLILDEWDKMQELSEQVCGQTSLCKLSISGGRSLKHLPNSFGKLTSLEELILTGCEQLEQLPTSFGDLGCLKDLNFAECVKLRELPSSFGKLKSLQVLNLESCWNLEALPSSFGQLRQLKKLSLQSYVLKDLPSSFGELSALEDLQLSGCLELKELPDSFGKLTNLIHLDLSCCTNLKTLPPSIGELLSLKDFNLLACFKLEKLPSNIGELPCLAQLDLRRCNNLKEGPKSSAPRLTIWLPDHLRHGQLSSNQKS